MKRRQAVLTTRRLAIASVVFGLFVLFDIFLFGWLFWKSLSQRELEKVLLEAREEAEPLAEALAERASQHEGDMWVAVSVATETRTYIDEVLNERNLVRKFEIRNSDGTVAFGPYWSREELDVDGPEIPRIELPGNETREIPAPPPQALRELQVPIGEYGTLVIGLSDEELQQRIGDLREDLTRQGLLIGILTILLLSAAFGTAWTLFRRARRSEEQALEAERLAYVGTLASGLAHEIRNPLNSLNLNMQMLEEEVREEAENPSRLRLLSLTRSELKRLEGLATNFLSYAKPQPLELEEVPAIELLEKVRAVLSGEIRDSGAAVEIEDLSEGARVRVDRHQINQLLLNLTQNALAATERSPRARLVARRCSPGKRSDTGSGIRPPESREITVRDRRSKVVLEVIDTGPGIPLEEQEKVFDLFYSTRKGGTGLGLAIVQRIAEAHDAEIELDSRPGRGTTVRLLLDEVERDNASEAPGTTAQSILKSGIFRLGGNATG